MNPEEIIKKLQGVRWTTRYKRILSCVLLLLLGDCIKTQRPDLTPKKRAQLERDIQKETALGSRSFKNKRYGTAIKHLELAVRRIKRLGDHRYLDGSLRYLAQAHTLQGNYTKAHNYMIALIDLNRTTLEAAERDGRDSRTSRRRLTRAWRDMAWARMRGNQLKGALDANKKALASAGPLNDLVLISELHRQRSIVYEKQGHTAGAVAETLHELKLGQESLRRGGAGQGARQRVFDAALNLARIYRMRLHDYRKTEDALDLAIKTSHLISPLNRSRALLELARVRTAQSRYQEARDIAEEALSLAPARPPAHRSAAILEVANNSYYLRDLKRVLQVVEDGLEVAGDDLLRRVQFLNARGSAQALLGDGAPALRSLKEALGLARQLQRPTEVSSTLNNLGYALMRAGDLRGAKEHFTAAHDIDHKTRDNMGLSFDLSNLGITEELLGQSQDAKAHLEEAQKLSRRINHPLTLLKATAGLGRIALAEGRFSAAWSQIQEGKKTADELKLDHWRWRFRLLAALVASRQRRVLEARVLLEEAVAIMESLHPGRLKVSAIPKGLEDPRQVFSELIEVLQRLRDPRAAARVKAKMKRIFPEPKR